MASLPTTQADRIARSLKRLGFRMSRTGRSFTVIDNAGELAINSKEGMSLSEIEVWIGEHIKRGGAAMTKRQFELDPELLKAMECERQVEDNLARIRICARGAAEVSEKLLHCAASEKLRAGFVPSQIAAWLRAAADRIEANGVGDPPTEMGCDAMGSSGGDLTMLDTTPITTEFTGLISTGTTKQALLAAVARKFPELTTAELSVALQDATAQAERHAARKH